MLTMLEFFFVYSTIKKHYKKRKLKSLQIIDKTSER